jgi:hypothetical protein
MIDRQIDSPIPMPCDFVVKNDSKIRSIAKIPDQTPPDRVPADEAHSVVPQMSPWRPSLSRTTVRKWAHLSYGRRLLKPINPAPARVHVKFQLQILQGHLEITRNPLDRVVGALKSHPRIYFERR